MKNGNDTKNEKHKIQTLQQNLSTIVNNPKIGLMGNIHNFFAHNFGGLAYNPKLTEETTPCSPEIPQVDLSQLESFYRKIQGVL